MHEPQISFTGNLAQTPTLRTVAGGMPVASFRVACTPRRKGADGEWADGSTLWFGVTCWRSVAENAAASLSKGDRVVVHGRLAQHAWTGDDGAERTTLEVDASSVGVDLARGKATIERPVRVSSAANEIWAGDHVSRTTGELAGSAFPGSLPMRETPTAPLELEQEQAA